MAAETKVNVITTRKSNKDKIMDYLKENPKQIKTSDLAKTTGIDFKNISRYLKELESEGSILREIVQDGKIRVVNISPITYKESNTTRKNLIRTTYNTHTPERNKERLYDIYFKTDTIENLAKKYEIPKDYLNKIKKKFERLKYPPKIDNNKLVCYQCGKGKDKRLVFHHNHQTDEFIALVCDSCNQKLGNDESIIDSQIKKKLPVQKIRKAEKSESKTSIKKNRGHREVISIEQMGQEVELFGRTIPLDKVREIARETLLGHRVMMEGVKSWLGVWKKRYHEYIIDKPEHFLIDKYEKAQETLEFLYKVEKLFKEITNGKS